MQRYDLIENFWRHKWYKLLLWKKFWVGNDSSEAPKRSKNGSNFRLTWSIIFENMKKISFSCNKNGLVCQVIFWLLRIEGPDHIEPKNIHTMVIWSLNHSEFGFEVTCCDFKKSFFWRLQRLQRPKKTFFYFTTSDFKSKFRVLWVLYDHSVDMF